MQQIKLFKGIESEIDVLERDINRWLSESGAKVINVFGNIAPQTLRPGNGGAGGSLGGPQGGRAFGASDIFLAVVYETA